MAEVLFLCYPKCSTCQKARRWLEERKISFVQRDIALQNPTVEELDAWQQMSGLPLQRFFNTSGVLYRQMELKDRLPQMTRQQQLELLATNGMLVRRPIAVTETAALVGFRPDQWETLKD